MGITSKTQGQYGVDVPLAKWNKLASLPREQGVRDVQELFYPSVTSFVGPTLQNEYIAGLVTGDTRKMSLPAIAQTARDFIYQILEIANNPALQSTTAAEQLLTILQLVIA